ncbi:MAG TPA: SGNH/GDSL hydrolase family protein [Anaerolineales bacterium]|nr:SGNH/GDSL hydrolase family protein [Anaerolineales bacterium]
MTAFRYLALGDSYTIGESVPVEDRWPHQLAKLLEAEGVQIEVTIIARTGWTVDELWQGIQADPPKGTYDLVTLLIGVNNQYRGYPVNSYQEDFRFMLGKAIEYAGGNPNHVVILSIPDWGFTPFAAGRETKLISQQIEEFNAVNFAEARLSGVHYVDVTPISRGAVNDPGLIAADGLHPSGKMYALWAEKALPLIRDILIGSKKEKR